MNTQFETKYKGASGKEEWLTPPEIIKALSEFDLDPCSPIIRPWNTAKNHYNEIDNGLLLSWEGKVWCNPPYGDQAAYWLERCALHGNAIALVFARTETKMFFNSVWNMAHAVLFIKGRLKFYNVDGTIGGNAGAPSILIAYGSENAEILKTCKIKGKYISLNKS